MGEQAPSVTDNELSANLLKIVESTTFDAEKISGGIAQIHAAMLNKSEYIDNPNFTRIHPDDLHFLFAEYDNAFFNGKIREALGEISLHFGLSKRMTSSGGKTARYFDRRNSKEWFEISVSTAILFECFDGEDQSVNRESSQAIKHWFGVGNWLIAKWRKALDVPRVNDGGRALMREQFAPRAKRVQSMAVEKARDPHRVVAFDARPC